MMKPNKPRTIPRVYVYLFFTALCVASLMQAGTRISSSHSLNRNGPDAGEGTIDRRSEAQLSYDGARGFREDQNRGRATGNSYRSDTSSLRSLEQLLFQAPAQGPAAKIAPQVLADTVDGKSASIVILLADQADVSAAYEMKDQDARGWFVYNTLSKHAGRTQASLKSSLEAQGISYQSFWAANMIVATADRPLVESLAARADVARVDSNRPARWIEDPKIANFSDATNRPNVPDAIEPGVTNVNAPAVWALGFNGAGMVISNQDTGMRWTHNALKPRYRGWDGVVADHNFNWHDSIHSQILPAPAVNPCGRSISVPCDDQGHGTHTTGTTSGDDGAGNQVGVAPGAKWIGCRNMDQGNGTPATYTECFQFFIAPTNLAGGSPDPTKRPHVMNNSWGCPISEGCTTHGELETIVKNTQAAGIFVVVSAGNDGPGCSSVSNGANAGPPSVYEASFSVGAISGTTNALQSFSSRGPSLFYTPNLLKPNISAPGSNVRSATRTSDLTYGSMTGTSMAGPHVVGVVALLWQARPALVRNIAATKAILQNTANPAVTLTPTQTCGGTPSTQIPNNSFGYGRVDALAAVNSGPAIFGRVNYQDGATPAKNATVTLTGNNGFATQQTATDGNGDYVFTNVPSGNNYTVTPTKSGDVNGIESLDASNAARYTAGLDIPTANQQIATDTDGDGMVTSLDASNIARYVAGLPGFGNVGTWKFVAPNHSYTPLSADQANQNFNAILVGDAGGNWSPQIPPGDGGNANKSGSVVTSGNSAFGNSASPNATLAVTVSLPHVTGPTLSNITVPITVGDLTGQGVKAYDLQVTFDSTKILPQPTPFDTAGTVSSGMLITPNANNTGHLIISAFQATDLTGSGTLINLKFMIVGAPGQSSALTFEDYTDPNPIFHPGFRFNAGTPTATAVNGSVHVNGPTAAVARISGQIVTAEGEPVSGATVTVSGGPGLIRAITDSNGLYKVENLEAGAFYTVTPSRANFVFAPPNRAFSLLADKPDAVFTGMVSGPDANPLESPEFFVRQQYLDVLGREPEQEGLDYWSNQLRACGADLNCVNSRRIGVSAAFFIADEFQASGSYIYDVYAGALGRRPMFGEYSIDRRQVVGGATLEATKTVFAQGFVQRSEFTTKYQANSTAESFVDALIQSVHSATVDLSGERERLIATYNGGGSLLESRAAVVRAVADNATFKQSQYNQAFVLTEYFSYLRRDAESDGYTFWVNVLNNGDVNNYGGMVCSFITSAEYQRRFSPLVTRSNTECGQ